MFEAQRFSEESLCFFNTLFKLIPVWWNILKLWFICEIWGFHDDADSYHGLLVCDMTWIWFICFLWHTQ